MHVQNWKERPPGSEVAAMALRQQGTERREALDHRDCLSLLLREEANNNEPEARQQSRIDPDTFSPPQNTQRALFSETSNETSNDARTTENHNNRPAHARVSSTQQMMEDIMQSLTNDEIQRLKERTGGIRYSAWDMGGQTVFYDMLQILMSS